MDYRNQNFRSTGPPPGSKPSAQMTRAERFEDEKRRITESCFSKVEETGSVAESYITHIRVTEDSNYPQTPHPPDSPSANKERVIIVAVRNTGRVRIHKARENANLSFSIGKTWNLEDLSAIQSWKDYNPRSAEEDRLKGWAGDIGFNVTIGKPYYWQAHTAKEKEFFVASLVKIYRKYTQGKVPDLVGFPQRDVEQMLGPQQRSPPGNSPGRPPQIPPFSPGRPRGPSSADVGMSSPQLPLEPPPRSRPPTSGSGTSRSFFEQREPSQSSTPPPGSMYSSDPARDPGFNRIPSREQMRPGRLTPSSSSTNLGPPRDGTPDSFGSRNQPPMPSPNRRSPSRTRDDVGSRDGPRGPSGLGISSRPNGAPMEPPTSAPLNGYGSANRLRNGSQDALPETALPERRRPPMTTMQSNGSQGSFRPGTAGRKPSGPLSPPGGSTDSLSRSMPGGFVPSGPPSRDGEREELLPQPLSPKPKVDLPAPTPPPAKEMPPPPAPPVQSPEPKEEVREEAPTPPPAEEQKKAEESEAMRPGLGRMFGGKQKSTKDLFKSAANAYGAFVPRAGGAGAKMRAAGADGTGESDGITGVFSAPKINRTKTDDSVKAETPKDESSLQVTPTSAKGEVLKPDIPPTESIPQLNVISPTSPQQEKEQPSMSADAAVEAASAAAKSKPKQAEEEARRKKRRSAQHLKYLSKLGIDGSIIENKGLDFESALDEVGWGDSAFQTKSIEALEADIRREIARVEAGSWLGHLEQKDDRVEAVEKLLDKAIAECDELDGLLTLYSVELGSLNDDIAFIEAQGQGLQVQTANQKLLQMELQNLVKTISISSRELEPLKRPMPSNPQGLYAIEGALLMLYKALVTIEPSLGQNNASVNGQSTALMANSELSNMVALRDKSDQYRSEAAFFLSRFTQHMDLTFGAAMMSAQDIISRQKGGNGAKLSTEPYDAARSSLWAYSPLMLFAKVVEPISWDNLLRTYQARARAVYTEEFRGNVQVWKKLARKATGDEQELLFTFNEKEGETLTGTARRITVKRSQTLAKGLRAASSEKEKDRVRNVASGSLLPSEAFSGALEEMTPLISVEQNFIVDFFHATTTETVDFADAVARAAPEDRRGGNIYGRKFSDPDREMQRTVNNSMEDIFASFPAELSSLIDWAVQVDQLQGVGIMEALNSIQSRFDDTNQEFLIKTVSKKSQELAGLWTKFVDEQIRAIEDRKVKIKKRKGVIAFIKTFPDFSAAIENQLPPASEESASASETRSMVDKAYERINKAMFESLRVIAKESPSMGGAGAGGAAALQAAREDPEDKEALNYHVLLIENMNHYVEEVDTRGDPVLENGAREAMEEYEDHLGMYVEAVIRRPLGKVMDFIDTLALAQSALPATTPPTALATRTQTSRANFKKMLAANDSKELRRGIDALRKRVEKHFVDGDEAQLSQNLVRKVLAKCEERYRSVFERVAEIGRDIYEGGFDGTEVLGSKEEVQRWFRGAR